MFWHYLSIKGKISKHQTFKAVFFNKLVNNSNSNVFVDKFLEKQNKIVF
jgi:hypothetical protein